MELFVCDEGEAKFIIDLELGKDVGWLRGDRGRALIRARIHRGAHEIGGNCVELELESKRLVLDLGRPLDVEPDEEVDLPDIPGLGTPDDGSLLGVILSHPHQDHYGLATQVAPSVPIYTGKAAAAILEAAAFFTNSGVRLRPAGFLGDRRAFTTGPFTVTPYLVDHSGFDSYALLVKGGGRRVTGVVLAPLAFYMAPNKKAEAVVPAQTLLQHMRVEAKVDVQLTTWDSEQRVIKPH